MSCSTSLPTNFAATLCTKRRKFFRLRNGHLIPQVRIPDSFSEALDDVCNLLWLQEKPTIGGWNVKRVLKPPAPNKRRIQLRSKGFVDRDYYEIFVDSIQLTDGYCPMSFVVDVYPSHVFSTVDTVYLL